MLCGGLFPLSISSQTGQRQQPLQRGPLSCVLLGEGAWLWLFPPVQGHPWARGLSGQLELCLWGPEGMPVVPVRVWSPPSHQQGCAHSMDPTQGSSTALGSLSQHPDPKGAARTEPARCAQGSRGSWSEEQRWMMPSQPCGAALAALSHGCEPRAAPAAI